MNIIRFLTVGLISSSFVLCKAQSGTANGTVSDFEGNVYVTTRIGNQIWTVDNLRSTKFADGKSILQVTDSAQWFSASNAAYCWYGNNAEKSKGNGALYNWHAVKSGKLAPKGWRVPTDVDWSTLEAYLIANGHNWDGSKEGNKIAKTLAARTGWKTDATPGAIGNNISANNQSGFSALPSGCRQSDGSFQRNGDFASWWSATQFDTLLAWSRNLGYDQAEFFRMNDNYTTCGFSVRLVRDYTP